MQQGHAGEGDRRELAEMTEMRATGMTNEMANGRTNGAQGAANKASAASGHEAPLRHAAGPWLRRGYRIEYDDAQLVQLTAPFRALGPRDLFLAAVVGVGMGALGTIVALGYLWLTRHGRSHIVSLLLTPERKVLTHEQWQPMSPAK